MNNVIPEVVPILNTTSTLSIITSLEQRESTLYDVRNVVEVHLIADTVSF